MFVEIKLHFVTSAFLHLKGVLVERILPDKQWQENEATKLDNYFMDHILQELIYPTHKPHYYL